MLYWTLYSIYRPIIFTPESAREVVKHLQTLRPLQVADKPILTAKLLDLQIKGAMKLLSAEMANEVLVEVERAILPPRGGSSWTISFCVHLVLFICVEEVQIALDGVALSENSNCKISRTECCHRLDNEPYKAMVEIFHMAYKTQKANVKRKVGLNPIRNGLSKNEEEGIDQAEVDLVNEIKCLMTIYGKYLSVKPKERANFRSKGDRREISRPCFRQWI
jgi:hypothetical protein